MTRRAAPGLQMLSCITATTACYCSHPATPFHRTNTLLEKVAAAVEQSAFYSALWGSILTSPAVRLPGVTFVLLHLNRKLSMEDQLYVMGSDIELMVPTSHICTIVIVLYFI